MRSVSVLVLLLAIAGCHTDHPAPRAHPEARPSEPVTLLPVAPQTAAPSALLARLAVDPGVRRQLLGRAAPRGAVLCGINVLGETGQEEYAWLACGDFRTGAHAAPLSAGAAPAVITANAVRFPSHAHYYEDIGTMFPPELVDKVKQANIPVAPTQKQLVKVARGLPARPNCRSEALAAEVTGPGGAAGGTYYTTVDLTNQGPDCVLTTGGLALWAGGRRVATLDLGDLQGIVPLPSGSTFPLHASVPNQGCFPSGQVRVALATPAAHHPQLSVSGPEVSSSYARCDGVRLSAAARRAGSSR